jgi:hypothetical protein
MPPTTTRQRRAWILTIFATGASMYALDAFAVAAGAALAGSGALATLGRTPLLAFLAATYLLWAAGLRANLAANWELLSTTGTSTNALSKAGYDLARTPRTQRLAAAAGYLLTEAAKEVPYYAGALGANVMSDTISGRDALIFLAGTNLGAAVYEYGLARATRAFLRRRGE